MKVVLDQGLREVELLTLNQEQHYKGGLMTGYPDQELNDMILEDLLEKYNRKNLPFLIIPPIRYDKKYIENKNNVEYSKEIEIELLPAILCKADFYSNLPTVNEKEKDFSQLSIIWFQDDFDSSLGTTIDFIRGIDWNKFAHSYSWDEY